MRDTFVNTITQAMHEDEDIYFITGDLGFGLFDDFPTRFGARFINAGVAEQNMMALATGLGLLGKKVICYSIANFTFMRCLEQLRNGPIYHGLNVCVVSSGGGFTYGQLGFSHFAIEDYGVLSSFSDLKVFHPSTSSQVEACVHMALSNGGPSYLRIEKKELSLPRESSVGPSLLLEKHKSGRVRAVVSIGGVAEEAWRAFAADSETAIYTLPNHSGVWDAKVHEELGQYSDVVVIEEHVYRNCAGEKLSAALAGVTSVRQINIVDSGPSIVGDQSFLRRHYGLDANSLSKIVGV